MILCEVIHLLLQDQDQDQEHDHDPKTTSTPTINNGLESGRTAGGVPGLENGSTHWTAVFGCIPGQRKNVVGWRGSNR